MNLKHKLGARMGVCAYLTVSFLLHADEEMAHQVMAPRAPTAGFVVDNNDRNRVVAFWHSTYQASEGYESRINWTGDYQGKSGTTSEAFLDDVERRLNFFRAMCGVDANARVNSGATIYVEATDSHKANATTTKSFAAQEAALLLARNYDSSSGRNPAITHDPAPNLTGWSPAAWNGAANGCLAFGTYGPGAITEYMLEALSTYSATSQWNSLVGHRRWCLFPRATDFATGDQPGTGATRPPTNVFYAVPKANELQKVVPKFVSYPPAGYVPAAMNSPYWSVSHAGANFTFATVRMTDAKGKMISISNIQRDNSFGDPAIIWEVNAAARATSVAMDTTYNISISGISGIGVPQTLNYQVTLINPNRLTSDLSIAGQTSVKPNLTTKYQFQPPVASEQHQITAFLSQSKPWKETAENKAKVIDGTAGNYALVSKTNSFLGFGVVSGVNSFHLTFPTLYDTITRGVPEQWFELDREIIAKSKAHLQFVFRRGYMTTTSTLAVEMSKDGGVTWKRVGDSIRGVSNTTYDINVSSMSVPLPKSSMPIRIRFRYFTTGGAIYAHDASPTAPTGIFIDDISTRNCIWLEPKRTTTLAHNAKAYSFNAKTAGAKLVNGSVWHLRLRSKLGGKWFHYGPSRVVKVSNG